MARNEQESSGDNSDAYEEMSKALKANLIVGMGSDDYDKVLYTAIFPLAKMFYGSVLVCEDLIKESLKATQEFTHKKDWSSAIKAAQVSEFWLRKKKEQTKILEKLGANPLKPSNLRSVASFYQDFTGSVSTLFDVEDY